MFCAVVAIRQHLKLVEGLCGPRVDSWPGPPNGKPSTPRDLPATDHTRTPDMNVARRCSAGVPLRSGCHGTSRVAVSLNGREKGGSRRDPPVVCAAPGGSVLASTARYSYTPRDLPATDHMGTPDIKVARRCNRYRTSAWRTRRVHSRSRSRSRCPERCFS